MLTRRTLAASLFCLGALLVPSGAEAPGQNWTHYVRIGAYGLSAKAVPRIIPDARAGRVFGIEVDNDVPGRYESFLDPGEKLAAIRAIAKSAHEARNKAFVYVAGTECITAHAEQAPHSMLKDHPDWLQRNLSGKPAVFGGGEEFWIREGDEDVWISPYAEPWRKIYMERIRQIAATGIDGIYVDIPYWMTHFKGWEDTWASFDDFTVAAFRRRTGLDARKDLKLGDFSDENFRKWVDFRISTLTDFIREIRQNARAVNPEVMVIPEIYPGIEEEAVRVGADVYEMYGVADAIAHEYEFGEGDHTAAGRTQLDWLLYQVGMLSFRGFAEGKASWLLNYSWDGDKGIDPREAMKTLAASEVLAGVNFWDAPGHTMAGSNDPATRSEIFRWIERFEKPLYRPRLPIEPVGVYFSPASRNYDAGRFLPSFRGAVLLLLAQHREVQVVTPRTLSRFRGPALVLPDAAFLSDAERSGLKDYSRSGRVILIGRDSTGLADRSRVTALDSSAATGFLAGIGRDAQEGWQAPAEFVRALPQASEIVVEAPALVVSHVARVDGKPHVFFVNFAGIVPHHNAAPLPQDSVRLSARAGEHASLSFVPFLGEEQKVAGERDGDRMIFRLPAFERGAVVWLNEAR
jgi:hypothetical protein